MKHYFSLAVLLAAATITSIQPADACTGITLTAKDQSKVVARTIEWGGTDLNSQYVIVPRGYTAQSYLPGGSTDGMKFTARYGYVGLAVEQKEFVAEGLNETGLSAGLFYFPGYGKYPEYNPALKDKSIADLQLVSWILGNCATVDDVKKALTDVRVIAIDPRASTVHWRFTDTSGKQIVLEIIDGEYKFYDNHLGVLTNSPDLSWQWTNLNNYVHLSPGPVTAQTLDNLKLAPFGMGNGMWGLPGDVTPPSRFVRAAFYQSTAPQPADAQAAVLTGFQILNNFDIPIGIEFTTDQTPTDIPSATQWTTATDPKHRKLYYRTMYNSEIRCFDLNSIDFRKVAYRAVPLDNVKQQPITTLNIK